MQPIKTTNAMNPAPAKGIESFPTPVIDDVVISEIVNSWKGDYQPLEYGVLWKDVSHAPNQGSFPEHKLVFQEPTSEDGQWVKRIWVNDRVNHDSYNYAIKYSAGSQAHPIYIRTYIVPRETYAPLLDGTPDPLFPGALLVDEEAVRNEGELDSKYITVTRVYETLPGPEVPTKRYNERGDLETVIVQTVPPFTPPDPDGLLVTGSQVVQEEMGKGVKTTSTVQDHSLLLSKEKKDGLLGETITTDDIVDPSTPPDELNYSATGEIVLASEVKQISKTKAVKRTISSVTPKQLGATSLYPSPIGEVSAVITNSIVPAGTLPENGLFILKDTITPIDQYKSERETVTVVPAEGGVWPKVYGVDLDEQNGVSLPYIETILPTSSIFNSSTKEFVDNIEDYIYQIYTPIDEYKIKLRYYPETYFILKEYIRVSGQEVQIKLPDELLDITAYFGLDNGLGEGSSEGSGAGDSYNYSVSGSKTSSSSATGDIYFKIKKGYDGPINGYKVELFEKYPLDRNSIIKKIKNLYETQISGSPLNNIFKDLQPYPNIKRVTENLVIIGGSKSKSISTSESASVSLNGSSNALSDNTSYNVSVSANSVLIPETLHGQIEVTTKTIGSLGQINLTYAVSPPALQATEPPEFPPGLYLMSVDTAPYRFGFHKYTCIIADIRNNYLNQGLL